MSEREPGTCKQCFANGVNWEDTTEDGNCYECGGPVEPQEGKSMTDLTPEDIQELATIVRENSNRTITEESEPVWFDWDGERFYVKGPGWCLSVMGTADEGGLEHARMALISLAEGLGRLLASGEYEENILQSQGKRQEAGITKLRRLHRNATADVRFAEGDDYPHFQGYVEGLQQALKVMGEHVE